MSFAALGVVCGLVFSSSGDVVYVKPDGSGDGSSWSAAANLEAAAGSAAVGCEVSRVGRSTVYNRTLGGFAWGESLARFGHKE